ncbi:universal stress protein [Lysobacter sp. A6]|uniref:Universal stress protein n=1 Tax=Noviluteimonas lactosilytica TaxID=2888523 RepID=A0ABS8JM20_9GAMM|nr:universal stress protein [Lysobacter lactosilyticus]MCC8364656.1 universal stress protein [Lysobacter lactosilyticus]
MKMLLAVDGSPISSRAAKFVTKLAKEMAGPLEVILFNADPPLMQAVAIKIGLQAAAKYHAENGASAIKSARATLKRAHVAFVEKLVVGEPASAIAKMAKAERCDVIVMGSHGHTALQTLFVGSVTAKVIAQSDVPVVVAR